MEGFVFPCVRSTLSQIQRLPGLPSSFVALDTVLGDDDTIHFEDVLSGKLAFRPTALPPAERLPGSHGLTCG